MVFGSDPFPISTIHQPKLTEVLCGRLIPSQLHGEKVSLPPPVQRNRADVADADAELSVVCAGTGHAEENAVGGAGPGGSMWRTTIKAEAIR